MKILIVDDEPLVRKSLSRACIAKGHQVVDAVDGNEGLKKWTEFDPDVVFLDVLMPGMSGPELLKVMRGSASPLASPSTSQSSAPPARLRARVILMSAYSGEHNIETAQQIGADLFIPKPFDDIFEVVARADALKKSSS